MKPDNYFKNCKSMEEAKTLFHKLIKQYHPDVNPEGEEMSKIIINQYKAFTVESFSTQAGEFFKSKGWEPKDLTPFTDVLNKIMHFEGMKIEIIGFWIYCFESWEYRELLANMGFWFSKKHKAWVYSGTAKKKIRTKNTTADIRNMWGSVEVETEGREKITA